MLDLILVEQASYVQAFVNDIKAGLNYERDDRVVDQVKKRKKKRKKKTKKRKSKKEKRSR